MSALDLLECEREWARFLREAGDFQDARRFDPWLGVFVPEDLTGEQRDELEQLSRAKREEVLAKDYKKWNEARDLENKRRVDRLVAEGKLDLEVWWDGMSAEEFQAERRRRYLTADDEPGLDADAFLRDALEVISTEAAVYSEAGYRTVRDVLHGDVRGPCRLGKRQALSKRGRNGRREGRLRGAYRLCGGAKCPRCAPGYLQKLLARTAAAWAGVPEVHRLVLAEADWLAKRGVAREVKREYAGRYVAVRIGDSGDMAVFVPGPLTGGEPVSLEEAGAAVANAILGAPAAGKRRWTVPKASKKGDGDGTTDDAADELIDRWRVVNLPLGVRPEDFVAMVDEIADVEWIERGTGPVNFKSWEALGVPAETVDLVRELVQEPLAERTEREREVRRDAAELWERIRPANSEAS